MDNENGRDRKAEIRERIDQRRKSLIAGSGGVPDSSTGNTRHTRKRSGRTIIQVDDVGGRFIRSNGAGSIAQQQPGTQPTLNGQTGTVITETQGDGQATDFSDLDDTDSGKKGSTKTGRQTRRAKRTPTVPQASGRVVNDKAVKEDCDDIQILVKGAADAAANFTHYEGFRYDDSEAYSIARPLARILARHGVDEAFRKASDPIALALATVTTAAPRVAGYIAWKKAIAETPPQEQQSPSFSGAVQSTTEPSPQSTGPSVQSGRPFTNGATGVQGSVTQLRVVDE